MSHETPKKDLQIYFFPNGQTAVTDSQKQVPELQEPWVLLFARSLEKQGVDVLSCNFYLPNQRVARLFKTSEGHYNWTTEPLPIPAEPICDFCDFCASALKGTTASMYTAPNGRWLACKECEKLIDAKDYHGLVERRIEVAGDNGTFAREAWKKTFGWPL